MPIVVKLFKIFMCTRLSGDQEKMSKYDGKV